jgi:chromosome segregation ATPase
VKALRDSVESANRLLELLQTRVSELQARLDEGTENQKRLAASEAELQNQLASAKRIAESKEAELSQVKEQLEQAEASNRHLRSEAGANSQRAAELAQTLKELQDIYRRRESYLNTLVGRYRDITEQYRTFASVLENRRGPEGTPGSTISGAGPEMTRIQNSIAMAEEDLRQLNTLNAQALRIQKKLPDK